MVRSDVVDICSADVVDICSADVVDIFSADAVVICSAVVLYEDTLSEIGMKHFLKLKVGGDLRK